MSNVRGDGGGRRRDAKFGAPSYSSFFFFFCPFVPNDQDQSALCISAGPGGGASAVGRQFRSEWPSSDVTAARSYVTRTMHPEPVRMHRLARGREEWRAGGRTDSLLFAEILRKLFV